MYGPGCRWLAPGPLAQGCFYADISLDLRVAVRTLTLCQLPQSMADVREGVGPNMGPYMGPLPAIAECININTKSNGSYVNYTASAANSYICTAGSCIPFCLQDRPSLRSLGPACVPRAHSAHR